MKIYKVHKIFVIGKGNVTTVCATRGKYTNRWNKTTCKLCLRNQHKDFTKVNP